MHTGKGDDGCGECKVSVSRAVGTNRLELQACLEGEFLSIEQRVGSSS